MENEWKEFQPTFIGGVLKNQSFFKRVYIWVKWLFGIQTTPEIEKQNASAKYKLDGKICTVMIAIIKKESRFIITLPF